MLLSPLFLKERKVGEKCYGLPNQNTPNGKNAWETLGVSFRGRGILSGSLGRIGGDEILTI